MSIDKIIEELENASWRPTSDMRKLYLHEALSIIRKHTKGMVLVPAHDMNRLFRLHYKMGDTGRWEGDEWINHGPDEDAFDKQLVRIKRLISKSPQGGE